MLTTAGFDKWMANTMLGFSTNPTVILIMILLLFFIVTMFMESIATLTLFMPILYPIATSVNLQGFKWRRGLYSSHRPGLHQQGGNRNQLGEGDHQRDADYSGPDEGQRAATRCGRR